MKTVLLFGLALYFLFLAVGVPHRHASAAAAFTCLPPWLWQQAASHAELSGLSVIDLFLRYVVAASFLGWTFYVAGRRTLPPD